ncbi:NAD(P)/FAD-dependent oxidoreductase [Sphingomonas profundi]|uniref:NAD(P)/FAD-dependent oxidoreductase n=1 Tax=Alterirhizorhabdus profundi TaxID=2681549 RepID=UPI0012E7001E|nr:FAD-dependent monooxygenase [Sphingomonas profundi]
MSGPIVVGGGPAGAAAALLLARAGTPPLLVERSREARDVVCGGFLGWDALAALDRIGVEAAALGARPIGRLRLIAGRRSAESRLPGRAAGLSRYALDAALLRAAAAAGARIERGLAVRAAEGLRLRLADGAELTADALFLATGKHDLRGLARPREAGGDDPAVGLRARLRPGRALAAALAGTIELHLLDRGYAGLLVQEDGSINLCLSVKRSRLGAGPEALLASLAADAPALAARIAGAEDAPAWAAIAAVPYGWRTGETMPGLFRLGDQAAVIASLAGDGVAIALASGRLAAAHHARAGAGGAPAYQRAFAAHAARPLRLASGLRTIAEGPARALLPPLAGVPGLAGLLARLTRIGG